jgi:hypothetical protein
LELSIPPLLNAGFPITGIGLGSVSALELPFICFLFIFDLK